MLTVDNAATYLIENGMLDVRAVLDGELTVTSVTRRNHNLRVQSRGFGNYLIKQSTDSTAWEAHTLRREAVFTEYCGTSSHVMPLKPFMPKLLQTDAERHLVIYELITDAVPAWQHYRTLGAQSFRPEVAANMGRALATLHELPLGAISDAKALGIESKVPWALWLAYPNPDLRRTMSRGNRELLSMLQEEPARLDFLESLRRAWHADAIIHGDVRMDNVLVVNPNDRDCGVALVDWETVALGDPAWDIAGALQDFLFFWISSMPQDREPESMIEAARFPLEVLQRGIVALWQSYCEHRRLESTARRLLLERSVRLSAARSLQTAYEIAVNDQRVSPPAGALMQVAVNIMDRPDEALEVLYGLGSEEAA